MLVDVLPYQYDALARSHQFRAWQRGLLADMLSEKHADRVFSINMGRRAGHTYFSKVIASSNFPVKTQVYVTRQNSLHEYADLLFDENKVHSPIKILDKQDTHHGCHVGFVIIDMAGEHVKRFHKEIGMVFNSTSPMTKVLLLQTNFL